jgi:hypothetical protein
MLISLHTTVAMNLDVEDDHLEVLKWLHYNRTEGYINYDV